MDRRRLLGLSAAALVASLSPAFAQSGGTQSFDRDLFRKQREQFWNVMNAHSGLGLAPEDGSWRNHPELIEEILKICDLYLDYLEMSFRTFDAATARSVISDLETMLLFLQGIVEGSAASESQVLEAKRLLTRARTLITNLHDLV